MNCRQCRIALDDYILNVLPDFQAAKVSRHIQACSACHSEFHCITAALRPAEKHPDSATDNFKHRLRSSITAEIEALQKSQLSHRRIAPLLRAAVLIAGFGLAGGALISLQAPKKPAKNALCGQMRSLWEFPALRTQMTATSHTPVTANDMVVALKASSEGDYITAMDIHTGNVRWVFAKKAYGYLAADAHQVYGLCYDNDVSVRLVALDRQSGQKRWDYSPFDEMHKMSSFHSPVANNASVYWVVGERLIRFDKSTGEIKWHSRIPGLSSASGVALNDSEIIVATTNALLGIETRNGAVTRKTTFCDKMSGFSRPACVVDRNRCYVAHRQIQGRGLLLCYDLNTFNHSWKREVRPDSRLFAINGMVYTRSRAIAAYDGATGALRWSHEAGGCSPLTYDHGHFLVVDAGEESTLMVVDAGSGACYSSCRVPHSCTRIAINGSIGLLSGNDGILQAFDLGAIRSNVRLHKQVKDNGNRREEHAYRVNSNRNVQVVRG